MSIDHAPADPSEELIVHAGDLRWLISYVQRRPDREVVASLSALVDEVVRLRSEVARLGREPDDDVVDLSFARYGE